MAGSTQQSGHRPPRRPDADGRANVERHVDRCRDRPGPRQDRQSSIFVVVPLYVTSYSEPPGCFLSVSWSLLILRVMVTAAPSGRLISDNACLVAAVTMPSLLAMS